MPVSSSGGHHPRGARCGARRPGPRVRRADRPVPDSRPGQTNAARTLLYLDCMRDLDQTVGPGLRAELAATLPPLLAGARWYSGRIYQAAGQIIGEAAAASGARTLDRVLEAGLPALRHLPATTAAADPAALHAGRVRALPRGGPHCRG